MQRSVTLTSLRSHTAVASGYLHKLAHNGTPFACWHQRYYVLYSDGLLRSFKSSRARNSHRVIHVGRKCLRVRFGADTRSDECSHWPKNCPRALCFSVINIDREYHFYCESEREFAVWRDSLQQTLAKLGSAHSSYVERRSSKPYPVDDDDDLSVAPTPDSPRNIEQRTAAEKKRAREDRAQKRTRQKETGVGDAYDAVDPAVSYRRLDEHKKEQITAPQSYKVGSKDDDYWEDVVSAKEAKEEESLEQVGDHEETCWSTSNYTHNVQSEEIKERKVSGRKNTSNYHSTNGIEAAFLEVQAIIDKTFNDMC
ncbi:hypothetical protein GBAR_LOCUS7392 [Geodia barretti]|uniref:PH domain-containing protein n=1 Tax=Geodia barretti TaxID=519541 RepID=A0AA35RJL0_GEOBA|nr:hypothetical protein GBAR_LOCUS7392 [Geodia barretti]